jgi:hypothetical protein
LLPGHSAGDEQLGRYTAGQSKHYRLYLNSGKVTLAEMYLRRVRIAGSCFAAALTHVLTAAMLPAPAAQHFGVGLRRPCRGKACSRRRATQQMCSGAE